jgi:hypothetical protein
LAGRFLATDKVAFLLTGGFATPVFKGALYVGSG